MRKLLLAVLLIPSFLSSVTLAQDLSVHKRSVGEQEAKPVATNEDYASFRPISSWVGERFVFLAKPYERLRALGYKNFQVGDELHECPSYGKYVGKIAKVVSFQELHDHWEVEFQMEDSGQRVVASAWSGGINGIAPVKDINNARERWLGKTLWYKKGSIRAYSEDTGKSDLIHLAEHSRVKVVDVVAGWEHSTPVRFVLRTSTGEKGYVDLAWSGTNSYEYARKYSDRFEALFLTEDPIKSSGRVQKSSTRSASL
jgi:hypothetical protein